MHDFVIKLQQWFFYILSCFRCITVVIGVLSYFCVGCILPTDYQLIKVASFFQHQSTKPTLAFDLYIISSVEMTRNETVKASLCVFYSVVIGTVRFWVQELL